MYTHRLRRQFVAPQDVRRMAAELGRLVFDCFFFGEEIRVIAICECDPPAGPTNAYL